MEKPNLIKIDNWMSHMICADYPDVDARCLVFCCSPSKTCLFRQEVLRECDLNMYTYRRIKGQFAKVFSNEAYLKSKEKSFRNERICVDIDTKNKIEVIIKLVNARYLFPESLIQLFETGNGYHIKIHCKWDDPYENVLYRMMLGDCQGRLYFDLAKIDQGLEEWIDTSIK